VSSDQRRGVVCGARQLPVHAMNPSGKERGRKSPRTTRFVRGLSRVLSAAPGLLSPEPWTGQRAGQAPVRLGVSLSTAGPLALTYRMSADERRVTSPTMGQGQGPGAVTVRHSLRRGRARPASLYSERLPVKSTPYTDALYGTWGGDRQMSDGSAIEWTEATWNPTTGCDRVSSGCENCYALTLARRLKAMGASKYQADGDPRTSGPGFGVTIHPEALKVPVRWRRPRMVFVDSMSDLFHAKVPLSFTQQVFDVMRQTPQHTYQLLTKRSLRLRRLAQDLDWPPNVWMGVSVENSDVLYRVDHLRSVPAAVKFLSCEPLLGSLKGIDLTGVDWVIAGGESGHGYRPVQLAWVRDIRDACQGAEVPFFFKQWGGTTPKAQGRQLDGRSWDEMPQVVGAV
jgi:protein gp37